MAYIMKKIIILLVAFVISSTALFAQRGDVLKEELAELNSEIITIFVFQSYYSLDMLQKEVYICDCLDSNQHYATLNNLKKSYKVLATSIFNINKHLKKNNPLKKELEGLMNIMSILKKDIDLFEKYKESKREKDYRDFLSNHSEYWGKLSSLKEDIPLKE